MIVSIPTVAGVCPGAVTKVVINESNMSRSGSADHEVIKKPDMSQGANHVGFLTFAPLTSEPDLQWRPFVTGSVGTPATNRNIILRITLAFLE